MSLHKKIIGPIERIINKNVRKTVEQQKGQLLVLDDVNSIKNVLVTTFNVKPSKEFLERILAAGRAEAKKKHNNYIKGQGKRRYNILLRRMENNEFDFKTKIVLGHNAFLVTSFAVINDVKAAMLNLIIKEFDFDDSQQKQLKDAIHRGHGEEGLAVSQVKIAGIIKQVSRFKDNAGNLDPRALDILKQNLTGVFSKVALQESEKAAAINLIQDISTKYDHIVTAKGGLTANYFSVITFQEGVSNLEDSKLEALILRVFSNYAKSSKFTQALLDVTGSPSLFNKIEGHVLRNLISKIKGNKNVTIQLNPYAHLKADNTTIKDQTKGKKKSRLKGTAKRSNSSARSAPARAHVSSSPLALAAIINKELPYTVEKNMGSPRLNYQTGRFAGSARITDVSETAQGYPSFGFTYMKYPYQVFEPGSSPLSSTERDPRVVIGESVRELAVKLALGRFFVRSV